MDQVFTPSEYVRAELIDHYGVAPTKVTVVGTGRGKIRPFAGEKDYANGLMLFVGPGGSMNKGGDLVLQALQRARKTLPHLRLAIVADDQMLAAARNIPNVQAHSHVSWETLQSLYEQATLFVMPARHQPWGLAYLEALSCRMPIVGLDRLSTPELTDQGRHGFVLRQEDPDELARVMVEAYRDPQRLAAMGARGQQFVLDRFTWDLTVDRMLEKMTD
jgi:glycosyltransferase involved in cell wall biosynthesis